MTHNIIKPIQLYRYLLRCVKRLPKESQSHYKHHIRQGFKSHADETDVERVKQIIERAVKDSDWLINKYSSK